MLNNISLFSFASDANVSRALVEEFTQSHPIECTTGVKARTIGFEPPFIDANLEAPWAEHFEQRSLVKVVVEQRKPSRQQITRVYNERVRELLKQGVSLTRKMERELKKAVAADLIKEVAPIQQSYFMVFDFETKLLWVSMQSKQDLDSLKGLLVDCNLRIKEEALNHNIEQIITDMLRDPSNAIKSDEFDLGHAVKLKELDGEEHSQSVYSSQDLGNDEIESNLEHGKCATSLELVYKDAVRFRINNRQQLTNIKLIANVDTLGLDLENQESKDDRLYADLRFRAHLRVSIIQSLIAPVRSLLSDELCGGTPDFQVITN
ncbi:recombination-associated protein RdgC [Aliagarivorans taiwanensis]|uniref:recombination-associated protein RdgC n=1 Tax=Aliagarivorans taiwanensis TaxID=561966 RepID=UPI00047D2790|nr:recombination-associated protein RdgC [Aliagarivorans taiwanensis]